jgi:hypothetical protein
VSCPPAPSTGKGLTIGLGVLCMLALLAAVRALLLPPWPRAVSLHADSLDSALRHEGVVAVPMAPQPPQRSADRDRSVGLRWRLPDGDTLQLNGVTVRHWSDWQVAAFTAGVPALALRDRRLSHVWPGAILGDLQGRLSLQTCLVPQRTGPALPAATRKTLTATVKREQFNLLQRLSILLGLRPAYPLSCTLLTLRAGRAISSPPSSWRAVVDAVAAELPPASR